MLYHVIEIVVALVAIETTTSSNDKSEPNSDGIALHNAYTMYETIYYILRTSNVTVDADAIEVIDTRYRPSYLNVAIPRIVGLYKKMSVFVYKLAEIVDITGDEAKSYTKLLRSMQLSVIIAAALDIAQNENDMELYKQVLALVMEINNMDSYWNRTVVEPMRFPTKQR
ncbi:hypothetical protein RB195_015702 [Necator americanus]|uniref:Uncharacterized protein n=1 Tax=Necator americanus TaxID=51031 RepID=A0ABR1E5T5_NECAM